jgi:protein CpxP
MIFSNNANLIRAGRALALVSVLACSSLAATTVQAMAHGGHGAQMERGPMMSGAHIERMLDLVDASDAQRSQIKQIMDGAKQDLKAQRAGGRSLHEQQMALFTAANIDAAAIESLRQQMSAQHEVVSKRMSQAMVEAALVLTPEQRSKIAQRVKKMQERGHARHAERQKMPGQTQ